MESESSDGILPLSVAAKRVAIPLIIIRLNGNYHNYSAYAATAVQMRHAPFSRSSLSRVHSLLQRDRPVPPPPGVTVHAWSQLTATRVHCASAITTDCSRVLL